MTHATDWIKNEIERLKTDGLFPTIRTVESPMGPQLTIEGQSVLNFSSNNYLGLANDSRIRSAAQKAIDTYGIGPTAVRTIAGTMTLHLELEKKLAEFKKAESVITFQSGFCANLATIPAIVGEGDFVLSDELNHASIIDACRLSKADVIRYQHCDPQDLESKLAEVVNQNQNHKILIVTDGVFSMDGDIAPLPEIQKVAEKYATMLMVDDAHGEGVLGKNGRGIVDHFGLHNKVDFEIGTLSKAFGVVGGFVAGKKTVTDWLRIKGRPFLFSSAMTIPDVAAAIESVTLVEHYSELVKDLWTNTNYFKEKIKESGFDIGRSQTPIIPLMIGDEKKTQEFSKALFGEGIFATAIVYPTVPKGKARIRVIISAAHTNDNLNEALEILKKTGKEMNVI